MSDVHCRLQPTPAHIQEQRTRSLPGYNRSDNNQPVYQFQHTRRCSNLSEEDGKDRQERGISRCNLRHLNLLIHKGACRYDGATFAIELDTEDVAD